jgi:hypothetical protein
VLNYNHYHTHGVDRVNHICRYSCQSLSSTGMRKRGAFLHHLPCLSDVTAAIRWMGLSAYHVGHSQPRIHSVFSSCSSSASSITVLRPPSKRCSSSSSSSVRVKYFKYSYSFVGCGCPSISRWIELLSRATTQYFGEYYVQLCR